MVLEPYITYPAATCWQPGWSTSAFVPRPCRLSRRWMLKMVPTAELTSMLEEPSSGSNRTAYLPTGVVGRDRNDVLVLLAAHDADPAGVLETVLDGLVGEHVELLLLFALDVAAALRAQDVDQAGAADRGRDDLGGERDVVQQIRQLARRLGVSIFLVENEPLDGRDRRLHETPGMSGVNVTARRSCSFPRASCTVMRRPSVTTVTVPSRSVRCTATSWPRSRASVAGAGWP